MTNHADLDAMQATINDVIAAATHSQPTDAHDALALYTTAQNAFNTFDVNVIGGAAHAALHDAAATLKQIAIDLRDAGDYC